ncbi:MAG: hypothetical protein IT210_20255 [Armatimonadetes bacterium]|nr:hypothetical protein [Armatimonadota bacterium]
MKGNLMNLVLKALLLCASAGALAGAAQAGPVAVAAGYHIRNVSPEEMRPEGSPEIQAVKAAHPDLGGMVYLYIRNDSATAVALEDLSWQGMGVRQHAAAPGYNAIWWRMLPDSLPPGGEGEIALCLRKSLDAPTEFTARFSDGTALRQTVSLDSPPFRIETLAFGEDLRTVYLYIEAASKDSPRPKEVWLDGKPLRRETRWLSRGYAGGVRAAVVRLARPLERGRLYTFRVASGKTVVGATMRAFSGLSRFGTYGYGEFERYAASGLNAYNSFSTVSKQGLDEARKQSVKVVMVVGTGAPPAETAGHPALFAYLAMDEPDVHDYSRDKGRPMNLRPGTLAMEMVNAAESCRKADPLTPTMTTLDLTFVPNNYFIYGPVADIANPDCYPISIGWPIQAIREKARTVKRAAAPRPFMLTYQGCWEEIGIPQDHWVGAPEIRREGWQKFAATSKLRGFGRAPVPPEIRMQMLYAIGCGARGLYSYTDATEAGGSLIFHSSADVPELWQAVGQTSRMLRQVASLIEIGHPVAWATASQPSLWASTLLAGEKAALVAVVNEDNQADRNGFKQNPARDARFAFPDLPWLQIAGVWRVDEGAFVPAPYGKEKGRIVWSEPALTDAALYLVSSDPALARRLSDRAQKEAPVATAKGKEKGPESYLKGRRRTEP